MTSSIDSRLPGFYRLNVDERIALLAERGILDADGARRLAAGECVLARGLADRMIENAVGVFGLPFAIAPNFLVNGRDRLAPMVVEEPSIVAGVSSAARLARDGGGFHVDAAESLLIGQIQLVDVDDPDAVIRSLHGADAELKRLANVMQPRLLARGGGVREIEYFKYRLPDERWTVVLHLLVDTCDAMGANLVNSICEGIAPRIETLSGARVLLKILSNLADRSLVTARVAIDPERLATNADEGAGIRDAIVTATAFADADPHRAATHNKGIMNGIDAVAIATGNDWRAIEAGAHAYAARGGAYRSLTKWSVDVDGRLAGELSLPLKPGIVGGSLEANPMTSLSLAIAGVGKASELRELMAAVGLAQNFAALKALVTDGIQKGHMRLHARSVAASAGAPPEHFDRVVEGLVASGEIKAWKADQLLAGLRGAELAAPLEPSPRRAGAVGTAFGKVILLGEHAAVYDRHVLALPLADAVTAEIVETDGAMRVSLPDWERRQGGARGEAEAGGAAALAVILRELGVTGRRFDVRVRARIPAAMGLGASAAMAVAMIRALDRLLGLELDNRTVDRIAFECEKLAHGTPSGIDNNLATYGEPVLYTRGTATRTRPIALAETPPIVIASSGERGSTREQVAGVRARYESNRKLYDMLFGEIDELSIAGAVALRDRDYAALGPMMNVCHGLLNALEVSTPRLETMIRIARQHGALGAKLTGAGGGGSIVALCPGTRDNVAAALERAGYPVIGLTP